MQSIDKDVPIPPKKFNSNKYPFSQMEIGDSILLDRRGASALRVYFAKHPPMKCTQRNEGDQIRVWRIA